MKKLINTSFLYLILALAAGVFYREFTKFNSFTGKTTLAVVHTHLFVLGVLLFLILALFVNINPDLLKDSKAKKFYILQNLSLILFTATLYRYFAGPGDYTGSEYPAFISCKLFHFRNCRCFSHSSYDKPASVLFIIKTICSSK